MAARHDVCARADLTGTVAMKKKFKRDDKRTHKYLDVALHDVPQVESAGPPDSDNGARDNQTTVNRDMEF